MKYMLLIMGDETRMNTIPTVGDTGMSEEFAAYHNALVKSGALIGGERLRPTTTATSVRVRDKKAVILTGPLRRDAGATGRLLRDRCSRSR
jgi:hypothetical protein